MNTRDNIMEHVTTLLISETFRERLTFSYNVLPGTAHQHNHQHPEDRTELPAAARMGYRMNLT